MTWSRRMTETIAKLNRPLIRSIELNANEDIYLPNIEDCIEQYWEEKNVLKNELLIFEITLYELYEELQQFKEENRLLKKYEAENENLKKELNNTRIYAKHFEDLYTKMVVSSNFTQLRSKLGIGKLLDFKSDISKNTDLLNFITHFPKTEDLILEQTNNSETKSKEQNLNVITNKFNAIFEQKD